MPRPQLPFAHANPLIKSLHPAKLPQVKFQVITREGQEIIVGRIKIQTPGDGHAFILRRFDTGAISLTTMFRAAFPTAPDDAEKAEASWIRSNYDLGASGHSGSRLRLAGTWIPPEVAISIAEGYALDKILPPLASAVPDPSAEYRRSTRAAELQGTPTKTTQNLPSGPGGPGGPGNDGGGTGGPNPSKRRKESSPAASDSANLPVPTRRSGRAKSSAVVPTQITPITNTITSTVTSTVAVSKIPVASPARPKRGSARLANKPTEPITPASSDANIGSEEAEEEVAEVPGPDPEADIQEQRKLIDSLKAEQESAVEPRKVSVKRNREEAEEETPYKLQIKEPGPIIDPETGSPREIRTNRRINLQPHQKSAAWGAILFAAGFAAMAALPSLPGFFS